MPMTFDSFKATAQFTRYKGKRHLFVLCGSTMYQVKDQRNGQLTKPVDDVLRAVYDAYQIGKPNTFLANGFDAAWQATKGDRPCDISKDAHAILNTIDSLRA